MRHIMILLVCGSISLTGASAQVRIMNPTYSFLGEQDAGRIGYYLAAAGDVNGDGLGDFMIGSYHTSLHGWNSGAVFLLLGREEVDWQLNSILNDEADAVFRGKRAYEMVGYNMAGEGDFNGDGYCDLLIGAPGNWKTYPPIPGYLYIVYGKEDPDWGFDCILMDRADVMIVGEDDFDQFGYASCFISDIDDDGYDDILAAAPFRNQGNEWAGKVYLILGRPDMGKGPHDILDVTAASFLYPRYQGTVGSAVTGVNDVNGDGVPDYVIGASGIGTNFLVLGRETIDWGFDYDLSAADCIFYPENRNDDGGWQVKSAGDINADGYADFLISGLEIQWEAGKVYALFGRRDWPIEGINLANADASFIGEGSYDQAGVSINGLGDFTGDGIDDFIIGARYHVHAGAGTRKYHRGKAYIIEGRRSGWSRNVMLADVAYYFNGEDSVNCAGWGVSTTGDLNGDSRPDLIISAPFNDDGREAGYYVGEVYVILGDYPVRTISGRLGYHKTDAPIQKVNVDLGGDVTRSDQTKVDGLYRFNLSYGNNFTVRPYKEAKQDIGENSITIYDAALTALHTVQLNTLTGLSRLAADVNEDGAVTTYDAALIAHHAVNLTGGNDSHVGEWRFNPEQRQVNWSMLSREDQDFKALILGEVSGNWTMEAGTIGLLKQDVPYRCDYDDRTVWLSFPSVSGQISADIVLTYDPADIEFASVAMSEVAERFNLLVNSEEPNRVRIGMYGSEPVVETDEICRVHFKIRNERKAATQVFIDKFFIDEQDQGKTRISIDLGADVQNVKIPQHFLSNYPNPFNPSTIIEYQIEEATHADVTIFNMIGETVRTIYSGFQAPGTYRWLWDGVNDEGMATGSGVYVCVVKGANFLVQKKMVKLK